IIGLPMAIRGYFTCRDEEESNRSGDDTRSARLTRNETDFFISELVEATTYLTQIRFELLQIRIKHKADVYSIPNIPAIKHILSQADKRFKGLPDRVEEMMDK